MSAILAIHAHPDDIETLGAGALALLAQAGHAVTIVTATAGEGGSTRYPPDEIARLRQAEAAAAAAMIGARYVCMGLPDLGVFNDDASRRAMTQAIRAVTPDVVITASPADYHPDHEAVSLLARDGCFAASVPNYRAGPAPVMAAIPHLYFMDPIGGRNRDGVRVKPDFAVDIGAVIETKRRMLAAHESQTEWLARQHDIADPVGEMIAWSHRRGRDYGVDYAEGFRHYRHEPYPRGPLLQTLLGAAILGDALVID